MMNGLSSGTFSNSSNNPMSNNSSGSQQNQSGENSGSGGSLGTDAAQREPLLGPGQTVPSAINTSASPMLHITPSINADGENDANNDSEIIATTDK